MKSAVKLSLGSGNFADNSVEQRLHISACFVVILGCVAVARGSVNYREFKLILVGAELDKEVENLVDYFLGTRAGTVDFVEHNQRLFAEAESLFEHESRLGHTALKSVYEQNNAVYHLQNTLNLAAEIGVSGGVHDVDFNSVVKHGGGL